MSIKYKSESESRFVRGLNSIVVFFARYLPFRVRMLIHSKGWGTLADDSPRANSVDLTVTLPDGSEADVVMTPDGTVHGLPGSPPEGLKTQEDIHKWYEKMKAFRGWE